MSSLFFAVEFQAIATIITTHPPKVSTKVKMVIFQKLFPALWALSAA